MNAEKFSDLERRAMPAEIMDAVHAAETRSRIHGELQKMKEEGKAMELSDEELSMLASFRRFKLRMRKQGEVFTWQTRKPEGIQLVDETAEIVHPDEVTAPLASV